MDKKQAMMIHIADLVFDLCETIADYADMSTPVHPGSPVNLADFLFGSVPIPARYKYIFLKKIKQEDGLAKKILESISQDLHCEEKPSRDGKTHVAVEVKYKDKVYQASGVSKNTDKAYNFAYFNLLFLVSGLGRINAEWISDDPDTFFNDAKGKLDAFRRNHDWPEVQYKLVDQDEQFHFQAKLKINGQRIFSDVHKDSSYELARQKAAADILRKLNDITMFMFNPSLLEIYEENYVDALARLAGRIQVEPPNYRLELPKKGSSHFSCHVEFQPNGRKFRHIGTGNRKTDAKQAAAKAVLTELFPYRF